MSRDVREIVRDEPLMRGRILDAVAGGPLTVPELAHAVARPSDEVMIWVAGLRKYGYLVESATADAGYYRYGRAPS